MKTSAIKEWNRGLMILLSLILASSCAPLPDNGNGTDSAAAKSAEEINAGVYLHIEKSSESLDEWTDVGVCLFNLGAHPGSKSCTFQVDEATLYFSQLRFSFGGDPAKCSVVEFRPYGYLASRAAPFGAFWNQFSSIDCRTSTTVNIHGQIVPTDANCFGGVAPQLVTDFPFYDTQYIDTKIETSWSKEIPSAYDLNYIANRYSVNDLVNRNQSLSILGDGYETGSMTDYTVNCRDSNDDLVYGLTVYLRDVDGNTNEIPTWSSY